ncbi:alpha/beta fold hydrolase [Actinomycetospora sp. TBRC 11914]|uniref:alpha/beta fold hydrolase n=1 Tax=Actinomycetospora sp. TBRC 11914 TaxID=2729387 RepID=UPI00145D2656|nr:alpha/beta fold hydrolase [Actinomycetospora sp. TBRC 11914]NMO88479.1 alpha/beta hydrolase [Actinomycetospora sp. TBRC 11914]
MIARDRAEGMVVAGMEWLGRAALRALPDPVVDAAAPPAADPAAPVVVTGGFGATAPVMAPLAEALTRRGHRVTVVVDGAGTGCAQRAAVGLARRVEVLAEQSRRRVHLVGHSRGGQFCRVVAARSPRSVASLTTLGAPVGLYGLGPVALGLSTAAALAGSLGVPGLATLTCLLGDCCRDYRDELDGDWPAEVPFTRITGTGDRTVPSAANHEPAAREVVVETTHLGLLTSPDSLAEVGRAIDGAPAAGELVGAVA